jgi:hypothetical protein
MIKTLLEGGVSMVQRARFLGLFLLLSLAPAVKADIPGELSIDVSGKWIAVISTPSGRIHGEAEFTQTGYQIIGWLDLGDGAPIPISAVLYAGKFVVTTHPELRQRVAFDRFEVNADEHHMKGDDLPRQGKDRTQEIPRAASCQAGTERASAGT